MRLLGFSIPMFVLLIGAYVIGAKWPGLYDKARGAISGG